MGKARHIPERMCAGCGGRFAKGSVVRFTVQVQGDDRVLVLDPGGKAQGRGAYVCPRLECLDRALSRRTLMRRLGATARDPLLSERFARRIGEGNS